MIRISEHIDQCYSCREDIVSEKKFNEFRRDKQIYVCSKECMNKFRILMDELMKNIKPIKKKKTTNSPEEK